MSTSPTESSNKLVEIDTRVHHLESRVGELDKRTSVLEAETATMRDTMSAFGDTLQRNTDAVADNTGAIRALMAARDTEHGIEERERSDQEKHRVQSRWFIGTVIALLIATHDHIASMIGRLIRWAANLP